MFEKTLLHKCKRSFRVQLGNRQFCWIHFIEWLETCMHPPYLSVLKLHGNNLWPYTTISVPTST